MATERHNKPYIALQIVGSPTSQFFFDLSMLYAKEVIQPEGFELLFAVAYPDGRWSVGKRPTITSQRMELSEMIEKVRASDLVVPHMFCQKGLTSLRIFFEEVLNIPLIGSSGHTMHIAQNKHLTRMIATDLNVKVPKGEILQQTNTNDKAQSEVGWPQIVKPNCSDNSEGLSLVENESQMSRALQKAFSFDQQVLVEEFIPGRELRGAVIEVNGELEMLPLIEYKVSTERPIRLLEDKYKLGTKGNLKAQSDKINIPSICPAHIHESLKAELNQMMCKMHRGLGCRDFSMYDFRVHQETGEAYLLEAGLFWSFSPKSMISNMISAAKNNLQAITRSLWVNSIERNYQA